MIIIIIIMIIIKYIQGNITNELITTTSFKIKDNYNNQGGWGGGAKVTLLISTQVSSPTPPASMTSHSNGQEPRVAYAN